MSGFWGFGKKKDAKADAPAASAAAPEPERKDFFGRLFDGLSETETTTLMMEAAHG